MVLLRSHSEKKLALEKEAAAWQFKDERNRVFLASAKSLYAYRFLFQLGVSIQLKF